MIGIISSSKAPVGALRPCMGLLLGAAKHLSMEAPHDFGSLAMRRQVGFLNPLLGLHENALLDSILTLYNGCPDVRLGCAQAGRAGPIDEGGVPVAQQPMNKMRIARRLRHDLGP